MAFLDDIAFVKTRLERIVTMVDLRSRTTYSIDPISDVNKDATYPVPPENRTDLDAKITIALNQCKVRLANTTYVPPPP